MLSTPLPSVTPFQIFHMPSLSTLSLPNLSRAFSLPTQLSNTPIPDSLFRNKSKSIEVKDIYFRLKSCEFETLSLYDTISDFLFRNI